MRLIYINELGPNYKGDNIYEFIFSDDIDKKEIWGDDWDVQPAAGSPTPPHIEYIKKVGVLKNLDIALNLVQNSDYFAVTDAVDGVVALGWEFDDTDHILNDNMKRLVFHFGEDVKTVEDKLYERDIVLTYEKNFVENEH